MDASEGAEIEFSLLTNETLSRRPLDRSRHAPKVLGWMIPEDAFKGR